LEIEDRGPIEKGKRMDFAFDTEQDLIRKTVREYAQKEIAPRVREIDVGRKIPVDIITGLAGLGLLGMTVSPEYGGAEADPVTAGVVAEELARADVSCAVPTFFLVQAAWGYILDRYGRQPAREAILPAVTRGRAFLGIAATEPDVGSDLTAMKMVAVGNDKGYLLSGEKMFISGISEITEQLPEGGGYVTLARTDPDRGARGMGLFYVPLRGVPGIATTTFEDWGRRGISAGGFTLEEVQIPGGYLIGEENRGFHLAMEGFDYARALISVVCAGAAMSALEQAMKHVRERKVFGQPVGRFEGVQFKLAEHWTRLEALRLLGYRALWSCGREQADRSTARSGNRSGGGSGDHRENRFEVSRWCAQAKLLGAQIAFDAINDAIQWHGAFGYTVDCPLELALKGVRSYWWAEGALEIMKVIVARELLGKEFVAYR
jgi:acyl-CoA dehydrogenase